MLSGCACSRSSLVFSLTVAAKRYQGLGGDEWPQPRGCKCRYRNLVFALLTGVGWIPGAWHSIYNVHEIRSPASQELKIAQQISNIRFGNKM